MVQNFGQWNEDDEKLLCIFNSQQAQKMMKCCCYAQFGRIVITHVSVNRYKPGCYMHFLYVRNYHLNNNDGKIHYQRLRNVESSLFYFFFFYHSLNIAILDGVMMCVCSIKQARKMFAVANSTDLVSSAAEHLIIFFKSTHSSLLKLVAHQIFCLCSISYLYFIFLPFYPLTLAILKCNLNPSNLLINRM